MKGYEILRSNLLKMGIEYEETETKIIYKYLRHNLVTIKYDNEFLNISMTYEADLAFSPLFLKREDIINKMLDTFNKLNCSYWGVKLSLTDIEMVERSIRFEVRAASDFIPFSINLYDISGRLYFSLQDFMKTFNG